MNYRKPELMLPEGFDPIALLAAVHLEEDRLHAQEQREFQAQREQQEIVQNRRQVIASALAQARAVSDTVLSSSVSEIVGRNLRSLPDPLPIIRKAVEVPQNITNLSNTNIQSFNQEVKY